jgi:hypothetical protein
LKLNNQNRIAGVLGNYNKRARAQQQTRGGGQMLFLTMKHHRLTLKFVNKNSKPLSVNLVIAFDVC